MEIGRSIYELENVQIGSLFELENVDISLYQTCRGYASYSQIKSIFDFAMDENANEDDRDWALYDGLWDLLIHQYTLYSVTPIALYILLKQTTAEEREKVREIRDFVDVCRTRGERNIFLFNEEIELNQKGELPIFSIAEILEKYA